jgi:hypothetical protein
MLLAIFAIIDMAVGVSLLFPNMLSFYLGIISSLKGLSSVVGGVTSGEVIFLILGAIDLTAGLMLVLNFSFPWFWILPMIKGVFSLVSSLGS